MSQEKDHKYAALVTDLGFCLEQLEKPHPDMPIRGIKLLDQRVAHHESGLGVELLIAQSESRVAYQAELLVASTAEVVPFRVPTPLFEPVAA